MAILVVVVEKPLLQFEFFTVDEKTDSRDQQEEGKRIEIFFSFPLHNVLVRNPARIEGYIFRVGKETFIGMGECMKAFFKDMPESKSGYIGFLATGIAEFPIEIRSTVPANMFHSKIWLPPKLGVSTKVRDTDPDYMEQDCSPAR